jgi:hypothetical protein
MAEHPDPVSRDREIPVVTTAATEIKHPMAIWQSETETRVQIPLGVQAKAQVRGPSSLHGRFDMPTLESPLQVRS